MTRYRHGWANDLPSSVVGSPLASMFVIREKDGCVSTIHDTAVGRLLMKYKGVLDPSKITDEVALMVEYMDYKTPLTVDEYEVYNDDSVAVMMASIFPTMVRAEVIKAEPKPKVSDKSFVSEVVPELYSVFNKATGKHDRTILVKVFSRPILREIAWSFHTLFDFECLIIPRKVSVCFYPGSDEEHERILELLRRKLPDFMNSYRVPRYQIWSYRISTQLLGELAVAVPKSEDNVHLPEKYPQVFSMDPANKDRVLVTAPDFCYGRRLVGTYLLDAGLFDDQRLEERAHYVRTGGKVVYSMTRSSRDFRILFAIADCGVLEYDEYWGYCLGFGSLYCQMLKHKCKL